jgi:hypothetical protein
LEKKKEEFWPLEQKKLKNNIPTYISIGVGCEFEMMERLWEGEREENLGTRTGYRCI